MMHKTPKIVQDAQAMLKAEGLENDVKVEIDEINKSLYHIPLTPRGKEFLREVVKIIPSMKVLTPEEYQKSKTNA